MSTDEEFILKISDCIVKGTVASCKSYTNSIFSMGMFFGAAITILIRLCIDAILAFYRCT